MTRNKGQSTQRARNGVMKSISARSMERAINKFKNLITSKTQAGVNASNVLPLQNGFNSSSTIKAIDGLETIRQYSSASFRENAQQSSDYGQLWEHFLVEDLSSDAEICSGVPAFKLVKAFKSFYSRFSGTSSSSNVELTSLLFESAARLWKDNYVYSSVMDRHKKNLKNPGQRSVFWYVGFVHCYLSHVQDGVLHFLAIAEVMCMHAIEGETGIPVVGRSRRALRDRKFVVFSVEGEVRSVELVQYSANADKFKIIWPYMKYKNCL
ncbi:uncharacterized protein B0P05DRAFT_574359 [Gilbertella persicaria]|uniref:uncharacterized protein n=1 Tax=Gilbertella persicaria TaxID=101096 RepID=UPI0022201835|nr:uncharacterized protein B0P05DRAFT_574359 [Gilbertella persicaria]KAI8063440.1 hypothetical protein B0P05DRAFT_574359 [Gilbertella persicaria]